MRPYGHDDPSARRVNQPCAPCVHPNAAQWEHGRARGVEAFKEDGRKKWRDGARRRLAREEPVFGGSILGVRGGKCAFSFPLLSLFVW